MIIHLNFNTLVFFKNFIHFFSYKDFDFIIIIVGYTY